MKAIFFPPNEEIHADVNGYALRNVSVVAVVHDLHSEGDDLRNGEQDRKQPNKGYSYLKGKTATIIMRQEIYNENLTYLSALFGALLRKGMNDGRVTIHGDGHQSQDGGVHAHVLQE